MEGYLKRLARDLDGWIAAGLVPAQNRPAILDSAARSAQPWSASGAAAILGAALIALAAVSFVAANWAEFPPLGRFAVLIVALWLAFAGAGAAFKRNAGAIGHGLTLIGAAMFGAAIILTAQTFNMSAFRNTGILIWCVGALVAAIAAPSRPTLVLASLLALYWVGAETYNVFAPDIIWGFAPLWIVAAIAASRLHSLVSMNYLAPGLLVWTGHAIYQSGETAGLGDFERIALFTLIAGALAMASGLARDLRVAGAGVTAGWSAAAALLAALSLQFPLSDFYARMVDETQGLDERWIALFDSGGAAFAAPALLALAAFAGVALWRSRRGAISAPVTLALTGAAALAFALPYGLRLAGPEGLFALRLAAGAAVYALAAGLIFLGAQAGRRFIGGLGVGLFIAQSLYIYAVLFGSLLDTALFFLVGGLLLLGLSLALTRFQTRLSAKPEAES